MPLKVHISCHSRWLNIGGKYFPTCSQVFTCDETVQRLHYVSPTIYSLHLSPCPEGLPWVLQLLWLNGSSPPKRLHPRCAINHRWSPPSLFVCARCGTTQRGFSTHLSGVLEQSININALRWHICSSAQVHGLIPCYICNALKIDCTQMKQRI